MRLQSMVLAALVLSTNARGADVTALPTRPVTALRERLQAILRGDRRQSPLRDVRRLGLVRARIGLITLEEATKALVGPPDPFTADRITRVLKFAERTLWNVDLSSRDAATMDGYLTLILNVLANPRPASVIRMLYHHRAWSPHHLDYLVRETSGWPGRPHTYRALRSLRPWMTEEQMHELRTRLRQADRMVDALAMLEEFGGLAPRRYVHLVHRLAKDLSSGASNEQRYRARTMEIKLRAIERVQRRWLEGDQVVRRAVRAAESLGGNALTLEFFKRLREGSLEIDLSDRALSSRDPLRLDPRSAANVLDFAACSNRLRR